MEWSQSTSTHATAAHRARLGEKERVALPGILPRREPESLLKAAATAGSRLGWPSPAGSSGRV